MLLSAFEREDFKDRTAVIFRDRHLTYREIADEASRVAAGLQSLGIRKGDRVALHLKNSPTLLASILGCWWIGAIVVPIRHWQSAPIAIAWCNHLGAVCLLVEESLVEKVQPHLSELSSCRHVISTASWSKLVGNDGHYQRVAVDDRDIVIILHTSGTTARPKAVAQSQHALISRARGQLAHLPFVPEDVVCVFIDFSHSSGLNMLLTPALAVGATVLLVSEFDPAAIIREMTHHGATITGAAPGYLRGLIEAARTAAPPRLRFAVSSSDKLADSLSHEWRQVFGAPLLEGYGMTEACGNILFNRLDDNGVGTVGRPFPGVDIRIVGPDGDDVPDGDVGELWCKGDFLFTEYWHDREATRKAMPDGWFRTGDQAVRDHERRYRIVGRTGFMIKRGGIFVSPYEIEAAFAGHPAVTECLAAGAPSERWGQEVEVFLTLKQPISVADLQAHAAVALGEPSRPVRFWSVDRIPKTAAGKVARRDIAELRTLAKPLTS